MRTPIPARFTLVRCDDIGNRRIDRHDGKRLVLVDQNILIHLTPTEYRIFLFLLNGQIVSDTELAEYVLHTMAVDQLAKESLSKHIDNTRNKLRPVGLNIFRVLRYGYLIRENVEQD